MKRVIFLLLIILLFITGCNNVNFNIEKDAIEYYGKIVTLSDFPLTQLLNQIDVDLINEKEWKSNFIWDSPDNALVPLVFDDNNVLYTAKRYMIKN